MGNRSSIDIASDVLEVANGGGASKMQIMSRAVLSHKQMKEYVNFLIEKGLLAYDNINNQRRKVHVFKTTEKGLRFIELCNRLHDTINEDEEEQVPSLPSLIKSEKKMVGSGRQ